jgi:transposase-like protein
MHTYTDERKAAVLKKLLPPQARSVIQVSREEGISESALYTWLKHARESGAVMPKSPPSSVSWTNAAKFAVVLETAPMNANELSEYCRGKGLYPEQVQAWKAHCLDGLSAPGQDGPKAEIQLKAAQKKILGLEKDLRRKEKALAESAALLVLQKKLTALWEDEDV